MSDNRPDLFSGDGSADPMKVGIDMTGQLVKGALIAGTVFFGTWIFVAALAWLGTFLPPESKEAVDPTPDSFAQRVTK